MWKACIAVVDASRGRLFTFERSTPPEGPQELLSEVRDLVDPARRLRPGQLFSESRPGSSRAGNLQYAFDDHREAHLDAMDAAFARTIVDQFAELVRASHPDRVILCASPHMLGELRRVNAATLAGAAEIPRDLVKLTPSQLREQLASYGVLPPLPSRSLA